MFKVDPSRGSEVLSELVGKEFSGIISCDFFGAYKKFAKMASCQFQFCRAHIIRAFRFLAENENRKVANYGKRIVRKIQEVFSMIHLRDSMTEIKWKRRMNIQKKKLLKTHQRGVPADKDASNLVKRLQKYEEEYFRFIHHPIPPTNNPAEQTIRNVTQGTRSDWGNRWLERFWSIQTTCEQQGRNLLDYMTQTLVHYLRGAVPLSPIYS
ncbi:MAG: transposase [Thermoguttaceae bacterium]|nr:transposase [Thermoguttaceae bacterium]